MATRRRKKQPVAQEFSTVSPDGQTVPEGATPSQALEARAGTVSLSLSDEVRQKVDAYDRLAEANAQYAAQVLELQDKIAAYIQEVTRLKARLQAQEAAAGDAKSEAAAQAAETERVKAALKAEKEKHMPPVPHKMKKPIALGNNYRRSIDGYSSWN